MNRIQKDLQAAKEILIEITKLNFWDRVLFCGLIIISPKESQKRIIQGFDNSIRRHSI